MPYRNVIEKLLQDFAIDVMSSEIKDLVRLAARNVTFNRQIPPGEMQALELMVSEKLAETKDGPILECKECFKGMTLLIDGQRQINSRASSSEKHDTTRGFDLFNTDSNQDWIDSRF